MNVMSRPGRRGGERHEHSPDRAPCGTRDGCLLRRLSSILEIEGTAFEVAYAAVHLASDEARYVTGVALPVDGGVSLRTPYRG